MGFLSNGLRAVDPFGILKGPAPMDHVREVPTEEEQEIVAAFQTKLQNAKEAREARAKTWEFNRLQVKGEQLLVRSTTSGDVLRVVTEDESKQKYSIDNILRPTVRASVGKHIRTIPGVTIVPSGTDREDYLAAEMLESYKDYIWRVEKLRLKYKRAQDHIPIFGTAIFQIAWDHMKGRRLGWCGQCEFISEFYEGGEECPYCKEELGMEDMRTQVEAAGLGLPPEAMPTTPIPTLKKIHEGGASVILHDVRDFHLDQGAVEIEHAQWAAVERSLPVNVIRRRFPEHAAKVIVEDGLFYDKFVQFSGTWASSRIETQFLKDYARLYEYHEMPSAEHPDGQLLYIANGHILYQGPNPYIPILGRLPFYPLRGDRNPGEFYGEAWVEHATGLQKERNKLITQMRTSRELNLVPQMVVESNSGIGLDTIDTVPGRVYRVNRGSARPKALERAPLPAYVEGEVMRMTAAIQTKAGVTDQELGTTAGSPSGRYAAILDAQSSETIAPLLIENSEEWLEMNRGILKLAQRFESPLKKWQVPGHSRVKSFTWANVNMDWDIELADEDVLSKNPALRLQQTLELLSAGVFTDPATGMPDMKAFARYAKLKMPSEGADLDNVMHVYAAQIPEMLARGENVLPAPWDDSNIVAEELMGWLRGPGRNADHELVMNVARIWMLHVQALQPAPGVENLLPSMARPDGAMGGQGGTPKGEGTPYEGQGPGRPMPSASTAGVDANAQVAEADAAGEAMAQQQMRHE